MEQLSAALEIVQRLGEQSQECDVLGNLGMAVLASRDGLRATELFKKELSLARLRGDRFAEKLALEHMAILSRSDRGARIQSPSTIKHSLWPASAWIGDTKSCCSGVRNSTCRVGKNWRGDLELRVGDQPDARSGQSERHLVRRSFSEVSIGSGRQRPGRFGGRTERIVGQRIQRFYRRTIRITTVFLRIDDKRSRFIANGPDGDQRDGQVCRLRLQEGEQRGA